MTDISNSVRIRNFFYKHLPWIFIILSTIFVGLAQSEIISNTHINSFIEKIGIALFSSGVFAAVLKSLQFTGIFREEIEKVILGTDFVKNRKDLPELWRAISKAMYNEKFPEISDKIESKILDTYLPTEYTYYYENFIITINIEEITEDFDIIYTQTMKFKVILDVNTEKVELTTYIISNEQDRSENTIHEIDFFEVDGERITLQEDSSTKEDDLKIKYIIPLIGKGPFQIHTRSRRRYSLNYENCKLIRFSTFTKNMDVTISHPEDVRVSFFNVGNAVSFESQHEEIANQISKSHKNDVLLPYQGFGMSFEKKKPKKTINENLLTENAVN